MPSGTTIVPPPTLTAGEKPSLVGKYQMRSGPLAPTRSAYAPSFPETTAELTKKLNVPPTGQALEVALVPGGGGALLHSTSSAPALIAPALPPPLTVNGSD